MFDYKNSKFWNEYIASLDNEKDSGLGGFCEYLSQRLEAVEQSAQLTALRRALAMSWVIIIVLLAMVAFTIGGN